MTPATKEPADEVEPRCWCCGRSLPEGQLVRLGNRPEAAVCFRCAADLNRRARERRDRLKPSAPARVRFALNRGRETVIEHGWHRLPVVGPALRWIGDHIP
jgi:hypothetical protein